MAGEAYTVPRVTGGSWQRRIGARGEPERVTALDEEVGVASGDPFRRGPTPPGEGRPSEVLHELRGALADADAVLGTAHHRIEPADPQPETYVPALADAHRGLVATLVGSETTAADRERAGAALLRVDDAREALLAVGTAHRRRALAAMADAMARLRSAGTTAALLERAPREVARVGYDRCMVSRVHRGEWIAQSSYVRGDADLAEAMTRIGSETPVRLDHGLLESDVLRRRAPILVRDAQRNPRTHRALIDVTGTTAYVAAPIEVGRSVVGFVHVDTNRRTGSVGDEDVDTVALIAECLGYGLERVIQRERMQAARLSVASHTASLTALFDDLDDADERPRLAALAPPDDAAPDLPPPGTGRVADRLTRRELEVLERVAAGRGNVDIAADLFVTEATVKAHVKHIFRKLGVANRAEAVSRYLRG